MTGRDVTVPRRPRFINRLPDSGRAFAVGLNAATTPFDVINYWDLATRVYSTERMGRKFDAVIAALERRLAAEPERTLSVGPCSPRDGIRFKPKMTLSEVYHYPTHHFDFHQRQLPLSGP
jgi:hypothetical protein